MLKFKHLIVALFSVSVSTEKKDKTHSIMIVLSFLKTDF